MAKAIVRLLRAKGLNVEVFGSAEAFLASASPTEARCLVVDAQLGRMSGIELCRTLAASGSRAAFIIITGLDDCEVEKAAMELGCIAYLRKRFLSEVIAQAIKEAGL